MNVILSLCTFGSIFEAELQDCVPSIVGLCATWCFRGGLKNTAGESWNIVGATEIALSSTNSLHANFVPTCGSRPWFLRFQESPPFEVFRTSPLLAPFLYPLNPYPAPLSFCPIILLGPSPPEHLYFPLLGSLNHSHLMLRRLYQRAPPPKLAPQEVGNNQGSP